MIRSPLRRVENPRQLDFFSFAPVVPAKPPPVVVPEPVILPFPTSSPQTARPAVAAGPFRILDRHRVGVGSPPQKCRDNLAALALLQRLEVEGRAATDEECSVLVRYVGWGGLPQAFDDRNAKWVQDRVQLRQLLTDAEFRSARATTLNAHYTSPTIIQAMYAALKRLGFSGGRVLEPACGLGHFLGLMPEGMRERSAFTGIEIDGVTLRLAKALYPEADLRHQPFEETKLHPEYFDLAISNVPFGDYRPFDPRFPKLLIHDYFFAATLALVRPGGLIAFVTSRGTLDKQDATLRELVAAQADLLGAIRLPNDAFKENANTEVTTDIVFLRKRLPGEASSAPAWRDVTTISNDQGETIPVNEYFAACPEMMLGEMRLAGRMYRQQEPTLAPNGRDLAEQLRKAILRLPADLYRPSGSQAPRAAEPPPAFETVKPHAFTLLHGRLARREGDTLALLSNLSETTAQRLRGLIRVRDALRHCLQSQWQDHPEEDQVSARTALNVAYDAFVARHGPISGRANIAAFRGDPDLPLLLSLEHYDRETGTAAKAAIFRERTIAPRPPVPSTHDARSALLVTLAEHGRVDLEQVSRLLRTDEAAAIAELRGLIFLNPETRAWETDDAYLSGNVRAKLTAAEAAAARDPQFRANVEALRSVQPEDLTPSEIDARLGSAWIPCADIAAFAETLMGERGVEVTHADVIRASRSCW